MIWFLAALGVVFGVLLVAFWDIDSGKIDGSDGA